MSDIQNPVLAEVLHKEEIKEGYFKLALSNLRKYPLVGISLLVLFSLVFMAVFAPWVAPFDPYQQDFVKRLQPSGGGHLLGTDAFGRDLLSRIIYGARISLAVGLMATGLAALIGTVLGIISAYVGGRFDGIMMGIVDILMAFPMLLFCLLLVATLGSSLQNVVLAIGIAMAPRFVRLARAPTLSIKEMEYMEAARALGLPHYRIVFFHVLPNVIGSLIVVITLQVAAAIIAEASISFLGLGVAPPVATWGNILQEGVGQLRNAPWISIYAGTAIVLAVLSINIVGDALRDIMDPKLKGEKR